MRYLVTRLPSALVTFFLGVAAAGLFASGPGALSSSEVAFSDGAAAGEVLRVEAEYVRANNERDSAALDRVLAEDLWAGGRLRTKAQRLAFVESPALERLRIDTDNVRVFASGGEAWVTGRARMHGSYAGRSFGGWEYEYTRRYERRGERWQVVSMSFAYAR